MDSIQDFTNYTHFSPQEAAYQFTSVIEASEVGKGGRLCPRARQY